MNKIFQSATALVLALAGLVGCDYEARAAGNLNPARVAEMKQTFRDLWLGHIYWVQHAVLIARRKVRRSVMPSRRKSTPIQNRSRACLHHFTVKLAAQKFLSLLDINIDAVREYSEATVAGSKSQQDAALARLAVIAKTLANFSAESIPICRKTLLEV